MGPDAIGLMLLGLVGATALFITALILSHQAARRRHEQPLLTASVAADPLLEARGAALRDDAALALVERLRAGEDVAQEILTRPRAAAGQTLLLMWLSAHTPWREAASEALYDTPRLDEIADALAYVEVEASSAYVAVERLRRRWEAGEREAVAAVARLMEGLAMRAEAGHNLPRGVELLVPTPGPHAAQLIALPYAALRQLPALCVALLHRDCFPQDGEGTSALLLASLQIDHPDFLHIKMHAIALCARHGGPEHVATLHVTGKRWVNAEYDAARRAIQEIRARHAGGGGELTLTVDGAEGGLTAVAGEGGALSEVKGPR